MPELSGIVGKSWRQEPEYVRNEYKRLATEAYQLHLQHKRLASERNWQPEHYSKDIVTVSRENQIDVNNRNMPNPNFIMTNDFN
ncbi:hypothetical protein G9A89_000950 [Geosiphon pyriformis]|nr:hypothetical protein G9A89_000950 [Geosiphon pyriformis]